VRYFLQARGMCLRERSRRGCSDNEARYGRAFPGHNQYVSVSVAAPATSRQLLSAAIAASTLSMIQPSTGPKIMPENMNSGDNDDDAEFVSGCALFGGTRLTLIGRVGLVGRQIVKP
jgi:hypothetical protein